MRTPPADVVTERQLELLALYASGHRIEQIAEMKFLSASTVKQTLATARERVGAKNLTNLCVILVDAGLLTSNGNGYNPVQEQRVVG